MPPPDAGNPEENPAPTIKEIDLSSEMKGGKINWADALAALESEGGGAPAARVPRAPKPVDLTPPIQPGAFSAAPPETLGPTEATPLAIPADTPVARKPSKIEELMKKPSMTVKGSDMTVMVELSNILNHVNAAHAAVLKFAADHPALIAPNIYRMWEDNLKETSTIMLREFQGMQHGKKNKTYDKRCICSECHGVFMVPLPNGVCDECRDRPKDIQSGAY